jgi:protein-disulfide isomerase
MARAANQNEMTDMSIWGPTLRLPVSPQRDHIRGPINAPITLIEYGDYQCPFCGAAHPIVQSVRQTMGERMRFVFRHFPLTTVHPFAELAAEAAEAAGAQKKFWPMHDTLYENQDRLDPPALLTYAQAVGIELEAFAEDLRSHAHNKKVREDFMSGVLSGVNGTPSFFINDLRYNGPWDLQHLLAAVQAAPAERPAA